MPQRREDRSVPLTARLRPRSAHTVTGDGVPVLLNDANGRYQRRFRARALCSPASRSQSGVHTLRPHLRSH